MFNSYTHLFPEQGKVRFVRAHPQHDEVRIEAVQAVPRVGVVVGLRARPADVVHYLVLPLTGGLKTTRI